MHGRSAIRFSQKHTCLEQSVLGRLTYLLRTITFSSAVESRGRKEPKEERPAPRASGARAKQRRLCGDRAESCDARCMRPDADVRNDRTRKAKSSAAAGEGKTKKEPRAQRTIPRETTKYIL